MGEETKSGRKKVVIPADRIRMLLESGGIEEKLPRSPSTQVQMYSPDSALLVARLTYEVNVATKGSVQVNPDSEQENIIIFQGDKKLSEGEELVIRMTTGRALNLEDDLGDLIHYFITNKDFPPEIAEKYPSLAASRMPTLLQFPLLLSILSKAQDFARKEEFRDSREAEKVFIELLTLIGYHAEDIQTLAHSSRSYLQLCLRSLTPEFRDESWCFDYSRLEHRLPLLPAVFAAQSDYTLDPLEQGLFAGVLQRYRNVPEKKITDIFEELNTFRNKYRGYIETIIRHPDYEQFLKDPTQLKPTILQSNPSFQRDPVALLAVDKMVEAIEYAHVYAEVYSSRDQSELEREALPLFSDSMRRWNGLFGSPLIEKKREEMIPDIIKLYKKRLQRVPHPRP